MGENNSQPSTMGHAEEGEPKKAAAEKPMTLDLPSQNAEAAAHPALLTPPEVMITPETPAPADDWHESKRLGFDTATVEHAHEVTQ